MAFLVSCNKKYKYSELLFTPDINGDIVPNWSKEEIIKAENDTMAYMQAYLRFITSKKIRGNYAKDGGYRIGETEGFMLINPNGEDISDLNFSQKTDWEREVRQGIHDLGSDEQSSDSVKISRIISKIKIKEDEFDKEKKSWYEPLSFPEQVNENAIVVYFKASKHKVDNLRLRVQYTANDWLFFEKIIFNIDGDVFEYKPRATKTDHGNGRIWEWFDEYVMMKDMNVIIALANAQEAKMKFVGDKYFIVKEITKDQINDINIIFELYKAMGGTY